MVISEVVIPQGRLSKKKPVSLYSFVCGLPCGRLSRKYLEESTRSPIIVFAVQDQSRVRLLSYCRRHGVKIYRKRRTMDKCLQ